MKKSFTLLEVVISITIFMIIITFIYKALDDTKLENEKFERYITKSENTIDIYKIIAEDVAEMYADVDLTEDKNKNSIMLFKSTNSFNDVYYENITYMLASNNKLVRIESKDKFKKQESDLTFYDNAYIDVLLDDVKNFNIIKKEKKFVFIIELSDGKKIMFPTFKMRG
ncbi:prepilin-type N-terminal cleavage/methylation domain-containing protein [Halarcobacter sp.]|uniref:prepilin-type N-terminal cleavage/methylation domain-containing protein n=1 Tax=Halarcobacter sp. TaxID=2321133 RepID=UPI0029F4F147|nr:prepilin-type N-terminal cleavage/methylation domain-containing protein [Halarcobacter sp.]